MVVGEGIEIVITFQIAVNRYGFLHLLLASLMIFKLRCGPRQLQSSRYALVTADVEELPQHPLGRHLSSPGHRNFVWIWETALREGCGYSRRHRIRRLWRGMEFPAGCANWKSWRYALQGTRTIFNGNSTPDFHL